MPSFGLNVLSLGLLLGTVLPSANGVLIGQVQNLCDFPVWCKTARGDGYDSGEMAMLNFADWYTAPVGTIDNSPMGGVAMKIQASQDVTWKNIYQIEYAVGSNKSWYDQSAINGDPFVLQARGVQVGAAGVCPQNLCAPGATDCEWPTLLACDDVIDTTIVFTIC